MIIFALIDDPILYASLTMFPLFSRHISLELELCTRDSKQIAKLSLRRYGNCVSLPRRGVLATAREKVRMLLLC